MSGRGIQARDISIGGLMGALAVALPWLFHWIPGAGVVLLPMHLPVLVAGLLVNLPVSGVVGFIAPLVSGLLTGMPPLPTAILMAPQLLALAVCAGLLWRKVGLNIYLVAICSVLAAQLVFAAEIALVGELLKVKWTAVGYLATGIVAGLPGIGLQIGVIPPLVLHLERSRMGASSHRAGTWLERRRKRGVARAFHGHLGPWLALGMKMGEYALQLVNHKGYFGVFVRAEVPPCPPCSCLVDGLQISTGCTYGKRNIEIVPSEGVKVTMADDKSGRKVFLTLTPLAVSLTEGVKNNEEDRFRRVVMASSEALFSVRSS